MGEPRFVEALVENINDRVASREADMNTFTNLAREIGVIATALFPDTDDRKKFVENVTGIHLSEESK